MIGPVLYLPAIGLLIALFSMTTNRLWVDESSGLYRWEICLQYALGADEPSWVSVLPWLASGLAKTRKAEAAFVAAMTADVPAANNSWLTSPIARRPEPPTRNCTAADKPLSSVFRLSIWAYSLGLSLAALSPCP